MSKKYLIFQFSSVAQSCPTLCDSNFKNFPEFVVSTQSKALAKINKAEVDVFLELSCFFDDPPDVGNLISGSSTFSKSSLNIWKFTIHVEAWLGEF